jgi:hypothetical protein
VAGIGGGHLREEVTGGAEVGDTDGEAIEGESLIEFILVPLDVAAGRVEGNNNGLFGARGSREEEPGGEEDVGAEGISRASISTPRLGTERRVW